MNKLISRSARKISNGYKLLQAIAAVFLITFLLTAPVGTQAQKLAKSDTKYLKLVEDSLKGYSTQMVFDTVAVNRFSADSAFVKAMVRALRVTNSFMYPFDSVKTVSKIYAPDSSFRIFTWELQRDDSYYRQQGFIQMKTLDGSLKFFPLFDGSEFAGSRPFDSVRTNRNWIGAIYYGMVTKQYNGQKYYSLFGLDDNDFVTTRKWIDVLTFDEDGRPRFGAPIFDYKEDSIKAPQPAYRFMMDFKKDANARLVYDPSLDMIIFDHLVSESNQLWRKETLIPDGDYEGFKWANGKWVHVEKVFTQQLQDGQAPAPKPFYDANGKPIQPEP
jgi:hypothetical protein